MYELFGRLQNQRRAVIAKRHMQILNILLEKDELTVNEVFRVTHHLYKPMKAETKAALRDLMHLLELGALKTRVENQKQFMFINLDWPKEITQTGFMEKVRKMPKTKAYSFLTSD
jgi:hypothetical protein